MDFVSFYFVIRGGFLKFSRFRAWLTMMEESEILNQWLCLWLVACKATNLSNKLEPEKVLKEFANDHFPKQFTTLGVEVGTLFICYQFESFPNRLLREFTKMTYKLTVFRNYYKTTARIMSFKK